MAPGAPQVRPIAELLPALEDPAVEMAVLDKCRELCQQAYQMGRADGEYAGYERGARLLESEWRMVVGPLVTGGPDFAELERRRWMLRGEQRTRETFADPHPDDYVPAERPRLEAAS